MDKQVIKPWSGNLADFKENIDIKVETPLFIIFAEYMGYVSRFIKLAEKWCDGNVPPVHIQKIMRLECLAIKRKMEKDYTKYEVRQLFEQYYEAFLKKLNDSLSKLITE